MIEGSFEVKDANDLLAKLRWELDNLRQNPLDSRVAFNFFVTAEHIPDWLCSFGHKNQLLPRICSHLANGAKHFRPKGQHKSVTGTGREDGWVSEGWVESGWVQQARLTVELASTEAAEFGKDTVGVLELAEKVLSYWSKEVPRVLDKRSQV